MIAQVRDKRSQPDKKIAQGRTSAFDSELGEAIRHYWYPVVEETPPEKEIVAVDGSRGIRPFASGAIFYGARAMATLNKETFPRTMDVDAFLSKGKSTDIQVFVNRKMEWLELRGGGEGHRREGPLPTWSSSTKRISLFGKIAHFPRDQPAEGMRGFNGSTTSRHSTGC